MTPECSLKSPEDRLQERYECASGGAARSELGAKATPPNPGQARRGPTRRRRLGVMRTYAQLAAALLDEGVCAGEADG